MSESVPLSNEAGRMPSLAIRLGNPGPARLAHPESHIIRVDHPTPNPDLDRYPRRVVAFARKGADADALCEYLVAKKIPFYEDDFRHGQHIYSGRAKEWVAAATALHMLSGRVKRRKVRKSAYTTLLWAVLLLLISFVLVAFVHIDRLLQRIAHSKI